MQVIYKTIEWAFVLVLLAFLQNYTFRGGFLRGYVTSLKEFSSKTKSVGKATTAKTVSTQKQGSTSDPFVTPRHGSTASTLPSASSDHTQSVASQRDTVESPSVKVAEKSQGKSSSDSVTLDDSSS